MRECLIEGSSLDVQINNTYTGFTQINITYLTSLNSLTNENCRLTNIDIIDKTNFQKNTSIKITSLVLENPSQKVNKKNKNLDLFQIDKEDIGIRIMGLEDFQAPQRGAQFRSLGTVDYSRLPPPIRYKLPTYNTQICLGDTQSIYIRQNTILFLPGFPEIFGKKQGKIRLFEEIKTDGGTLRPRFQGELDPNNLEY